MRSMRRDRTACPPPPLNGYGYGYGYDMPPSPASSTASWDQTALMNQFQTMGLQAPPQQWVMDTGSSSHFASDPGMLTFVSSPSSRAVIIGNGSSVPITATGHARFPISTSYRPLYLRNVLVAPNIVKNLLSVRQFTTYNCVSVEFDPLGFSVKDLLTRTEILRCNSCGALYPVSATSSHRPHAFVVVDQALWHRRLGHPGRPVMDSLARSSVIPREKNKSPPSLWHACHLGRHVRLPFHATNRVTVTPFQIIHCDLWTSPVESISGFKYYLVCLDDFTQYAWVYPLRSKS